MMVNIDCLQMLWHFLRATSQYDNLGVLFSERFVQRVVGNAKRYGMWLADSFFAAYSQVDIDNILHLCTAAQKKPTPVLNLLNLTLRASLLLGL